MMLNSLDWLVELMIGPVAITIGTIAVCIIGFGALTGHLNQARLIRIVLGLCIVFAAPQIAEALRSMTPLAVGIPEWAEDSSLKADQEHERPRTICWTC